MQGNFAFQRIGSSTSLAFSTTVANSTTLTIVANGVVEIANLSATNPCAFLFTDAGGSSATAATTSARTVPPLGIMQERLVQGASYVSVIASSGTGTLVFTPGAING